ncbi:MAG: hypothetical protein QM579_01380 [Desulfovibrio sp.]|uniref:hypothetical protein n=1 Tax=Desulfovibrio sp. TaxID=885 RepID=UPI0039E7206B
MQQADNAQRTTPEVISLFSELAKVEEQRTAIMRQIEAAVGITRPSEQRKSKRKAPSEAEFLAAMGVRRKRT